MKLAEINPYIRRAMRSYLPPLWRINQRIILDYEIIYVESGHFQLTYDHCTYSCKAGDVIFLCPNISHTLFTDIGVSQPHIHFDVQYDPSSEQVFICFRDYPELSPQERRLIRKNIFPQLTPSPLLKIQDHAAFLELFYRIIDAPNHQSLSCKTSMLALLEIIIADNVPNALMPAPQTASIAAQIKEFLDANFCQNISLSALEKQFSYSKFYIAKAYGCRTGTFEKPLCFRNRPITGLFFYLHFQSGFLYILWRKSYQIPSKQNLLDLKCRFLVFMFKRFA